MIEVFAPTVVTVAGITEQVVPYLYSCGVTESGMVDESTHTAFTECVSRDDYAVSAGIIDFLIPNIYFYSARAALTAALVPTIKVSAVLCERMVPAVKRFASVAEIVVTASTTRSGITERCLLPVSQQSGITEQLTVSIETFAAILLSVVPTAAVADVFLTLLMNTHTAGMAEYTSYPFTSLFRLGTDCYGIKADGLFKLAGKDDDGKEITADVLTGISDFGIDQKKILTQAWLELRGEGEMDLTIFLEEEDDEGFSYRELCDNAQKLNYQKVKLDMGVKGSHVQARLQNVDGSDFALQTIRLVAVPTSRR